jgi:hypothetical protein
VQKSIGTEELAPDVGHGQQIEKRTGTCCTNLWQPKVAGAREVCAPAAGALVMPAHGQDTWTRQRMRESSLRGFDGRVENDESALKAEGAGYPRRGRQ